jgi:hypothetical protein
MDFEKDESAKRGLGLFGPRLVYLGKEHLMSQTALEAEYLEPLPDRVELYRFGSNTGAYVGVENITFLIQINDANQSMDGCVSNCTQIVNQYNFAFVFQFSR